MTELPWQHDPTLMPVLSGSSETMSSTSDIPAGQPDNIISATPAVDIWSARPPIGWDGNSAAFLEHVSKRGGLKELMEV